MRCMLTLRDAIRMHAYNTKFFTTPVRQLFIIFALSHCSDKMWPVAKKKEEAEKQETKKTKI